MITALASLLLAAVPTGTIPVKSGGDHIIASKTGNKSRPASNAPDHAKNNHARLEAAKTGDNERPEAASGAAAPASSWADIPVQTRYVMIMGAMDAAAASRIMGSTKAPLCPGKLNNIDLDARLTADGYIAAGDALGEALRATIAQAAPNATCDDTVRGYDVRLVSGMSDEHLSAYITQAVATLDLPEGCALQRSELQDMQNLAARLAGGILAADDKTTKPADQIAKTTAEACKQPRDETAPDEAESASESN